jgi:hypothetical protein
VAAFEGSLQGGLGLAPDDFVVAVAVEGGIDPDRSGRCSDQVDACIGELGELFQVVAAVDDAGVE